MSSNFGLMLAILLGIGLPNPSVAQNPPAVQITQYSLQLEPNLIEKSVSGTVQIHLLRDSAEQSSISLNAGSLEILNVLIDSQQSPFVKQNDIVVIELPQANSNDQHLVQIEYQGQPRYGMKFGEGETEVSTAFSTSQWMPSVDAPSVRAGFELAIVLPANFIVAAPGQPLAKQLLPNGKVNHRWIASEAVPAYLYGFAAGEFREVIDSEQRPTLRFLAPPEFSAQQVLQIFQDTRSMINYFEEKSGINYPSEVYTQVLLRNGSGQELDDMAVFGQRYGAEVLADDTAIWLGAHEVAHQWWGNKVSNQDWTHFWLHEGLVSFMTAAYLGHRFGAQTYAENINTARQQYLNLAGGGYDRPLVFPNWDNPSRQDRSIVYDKGSYVLHLLKDLLGDEVFWRGIKLYTTQNWGKSVRSNDF